MGKSLIERFYRIFQNKKEEAGVKRPRTSSPHIGAEGTMDNSRLVLEQWLDFALFVCVSLLEALVDFVHNHRNWSIRRFQVPRF